METVPQRRGSSGPRESLGELMGLFMEGVSAGRLDGKRDLQLLQHRFGELSQRSREWVRTAGDDELLRWSLRVLHAKFDLEDIFGP